MSLSYPATRHAPAPLVDLSDRAERDRLSSDAVRAFFNIMARWNVRDEQARQLLGGISNGAFYELKKGKGGVLGEDRLRRISYLVGIFKALGMLYRPELAERWMRLPNRNRLFEGATPLDYLIRGGLPAFATLRQLLDARRGGG
jgi:hypothetical protein